ncbi:MAG: hypothetical protein JNL98_18375 [Bryobacterales bacterium]|nr:hypothetical protein [Bryobacterales bacterium]
MLQRLFWPLLGIQMMGVMFLLGASVVDLMIRGDRGGGGSTALMLHCGAPMLFLCLMGAIFHYSRWAALQWLALVMVMAPGALVLTGTLRVS